MFEYKIIKFGLFYLTLSTATVLGNCKPVLARNTAIALSNNIVRQDLLASATLSQAAMLDSDFIAYNNDRIVIKDKLATTQIAVDNLAKNDLATEKKLEAAESNLKLIRLIFLSFFFLLFIPLVIFYPLFLFYQKLLSGERDNDNYPSQFSQAAENTDSLHSSTFTKTNNSSDGQNRLEEPRDLPVKNFSQSTLKSIENEKIQTEELEILPNSNLEQRDIVTATVSKLQIAFSPQASKLRWRLSQITSSLEECSDRDLVELMQQAVSVILSQPYWTHVSYSSEPLPLAKIHSEFEMISQLELNKCINKELNLVRSDRDRDSYRSSEGENFYSYVVVTLILCTSKPVPLFDNIYTKGQLIAELIKLGKIEGERLMKFELLWNPRQESTYISNKQLLTQYSDLTRLL